MWAEYGRMQVGICCDLLMPNHDRHGKTPITLVRARFSWIWIAASATSAASIRVFQLFAGFSDVPDITAEFHLYPVPEQAVSTRLVEGLAYLPSVWWV